jgi:hypothetical protein
MIEKSITYEIGERKSKVDATHVHGFFWYKVVRKTRGDPLEIHPNANSLAVHVVITVKPTFVLVVCQI